MDDDLIAVPREEYEQLRRDSFFLEALRAAGVNNWEWYSEAFPAYEEMLAAHGLASDDD